jgi:hypothetical protein
VSPLVRLRSFRRISSVSVAESPFNVLVLPFFETWRLTLKIRAPRAQPSTFSSVCPAISARLIAPPYFPANIT